MFNCVGWGAQSDWKISIHETNSFLLWANGNGDKKKMKNIKHCGATRSIFNSSQYFTLSFSSQSSAMEGYDSSKRTKKKN